jgi:hypothetical protein
MTDEPIMLPDAASIDGGGGDARVDVTFDNGNRSVVVGARPRQGVAELLTAAD